MNRSRLSTENAVGRSGWCWALVVGLVGLVGCEDPVAPAAQGAANFNFSRSIDSKCDKPLNTRAGVGSVTGKDRSAVTDGQDGNTVTCRVIPNGAGFDVSLNVANAEESFSLSGTLTPGVESPVKVQVYSSVIKSKFFSVPDAPCKAWVQDAAYPDLSVSAGKVWGAFRCEKIYESGNENTTPCGILNGDPKAPGGYFVFENCVSE